MAIQTFDASKGQIRSGWEDRQDADNCYITGVPPIDPSLGFTDWCPESEGLTTEPGEITTNAIGCKTTDLSKATTGGPVTGNFDWEMLLPWLVMVQDSKARNPTALTAGQSFRHVIAPSETDLDLPLSRYIRVFRDDSFIETLLNAQPSQIQITWGVSDFVEFTAQILFERATDWDFWEVVNETGAPERPYLRGAATWAQRQLADRDIYVRVQDAVTGTVEVKIGAASAYGATMVVTPGGWVQVVDEAGNDIGDISNPTQIYVGDIAGWTNADEWVYRATSVNLWASSFPLAVAANEIDMTVFLEGQEIDTESGTLTIDNPRALDLAAGGLFPKGIRSDGSQSVSGQLVLRYTDLNLRHRQVTGEPFELEIVFGSRTSIGTSNDRYNASFYMPKSKFTGPTPTLASDTEYNRDFSFSADDDPTNALPDRLTITVDNGISDLATV